MTKPPNPFLWVILLVVVVFSSVVVHYSVVVLKRNIIYPDTHKDATLIKVGETFATYKFTGVIQGHETNTIVISYQDEEYYFKGTILSTPSIVTLDPENHYQLWYFYGELRVKKVN